MKGNDIIQFIGVSPEEVNQPVLNEIRNGFERLIKEFQPRVPEEYLTRQEVRDFLKCDISTVHNLTKRGKLKSYGIGGRVYYKRSELESAIQPLN